LTPKRTKIILRARLNREASELYGSVQSDAAA
jgi:hypothetical protein